MTESTCDLCTNPARDEIVVMVDIELGRDLCASHSAACRTALDLFHVDYVARRLA